ncbi:hypothetical protein B0T13DRAFT_533990 [Neurospora crassa]|nr:hypothetical protein B0T13DRAFT_533990 [Neurospora crassa]
MKLCHIDPSLHAAVPTRRGMIGLVTMAAETIIDRRDAGGHNIPTRKTSGMKLIFTLATSALLATVSIIASPIIPNSAARDKNTVIVSAVTVSRIKHPTTTIVNFRSEVSKAAGETDSDIDESAKSDESGYTTSVSEHEISDEDASSSSESHLNFLTRRNGLPKGLHCAHHGALWFAGCKNNDPKDCRCNYVKAWSVTWHRERPVRDSDGHLTGNEE